MTTLPDWLILESNHRIGARNPGLYTKPLRRTLARIGEILAKELTSSVKIDSWLFRMEPRAKIICIFLLLVCGSILQNLETLFALLFLAFFVGLSARISVQRLARVWLGVPLFSLAIILPASLNLITPGETAFILWRIGPEHNFFGYIFPPAITITWNGLMVAGRFLLRSICCVSLVWLLIASTDSAVLLNAFRRLGLPKVFGMILMMCQRYLVTLLHSAEEIHLAKLSRSISVSSLRKEQHWVAAGTGILFRKTYFLAQEVYNAMIARGYDGDLQVSRTGALQRADFIWMTGAFVFVVFLYLTDRLL